MARRDEKREALVILFLLLDKVSLRCQVIELSEPLDELGAQVYRHMLFLVPPLMCRSRLRAMTTISLAMTLRATQNLSRLAAGDKGALSPAAKRACIANTCIPANPTGFSGKITENSHPSRYTGEFIKSTGFSKNRMYRHKPRSYTCGVL